MVEAAICFYIAKFLGSVIVCTPKAENKGVLIVDELKNSKDKDIVVYCSIGRRSAEADNTLENKRYTKVYNSADGVTEYEFKLIK